MSHLYFDLIGGISGDMIVASLLDITGDFNYLKKELKRIELDSYDLSLVSCQSGHISSHRFSVKDLAQRKRVFQIDEIKEKIKKSGLSLNIKDNVIRIYETLYKAESKVHGTDHAHFEQIGEVDSVIDIASACILIDRLKVEEVLYSRIPFGEKVAPATTLMLESQRIYFSKHEFENITPTGVAIITTLGRYAEKEASAEFIVEKVGYGIGSVDADNLQNVLRVVLLKKCEILGSTLKEEFTVR